MRRALAACATALCAAAGVAQSAERNITDLSLEELTNVVITSVSRREESVLDAAASIYVISAEDIRRAGVRSLPDALRLAPNLQVARNSASTYAISARGFNNAIGNKLLVLIDGRTVYTPLFSGVFWDQQDVMLEDIARIEVISGPGATLWGANAVNGVINVITKASQDTTGFLAAAGGGNADYSGALRYGARMGDSAHFRVYVKDLGIDNTSRENVMPAPDGFHRKQGGFRTDWSEGTRALTVQGDVYEGKTEARPISGPVETSGSNLIARWKQTFASGSDLRVQAYYDYNERVDRAAFQGKVSTFDLEFQNGIPLGEHRLLWGAGYRRAHDNIDPAGNPPLQLFFVPASRTLTWQNIFVQDAWKWRPDLELTLGIKAENNDYTGWEFLPSARIGWKADEGRLLWAALSRAVRAPARLDRDFRLNFVAGPVTVPVVLGGPYFVSEVAKVLEVGYRAQPSRVLSYSITAFRQNYEKLRSGMPPPAFIENQMEGFEQGIEAWGTFQATPGWRLSGGFSTLNQHFGRTPASRDPTGPIALGNDPDYQWQLRSAHTLPHRQEIDIIARRVSSLPLQAVGVSVPAYTAVDVRWGWRINRSVELSLTAQNLFDPRHPEFDAPPLRSEYRRNVFFKVVVSQ